MCKVGLENASMSRVILRFVWSRAVVAAVVITVSVALILFSVVSISLPYRTKLRERLIKIGGSGSVHKGDGMSYQPSSRQIHLFVHL